ncbi:NAD(P)H-binding protein [Rapidithrix thailandica]|uniref:NAD(P)H-binding protein n=1 Tax=Rapidithrix thailandica TaxID=413964 RepID=A0AAW9SH48_9BACT
MKIVATGSLGNISKSLAQDLMEKGHEITIISSSSERKKTIEEIGAKAAIGRMEDIGFLTKTFKDAEVVYLMEAVEQSKMFDPNFDIIEAYSNIAKNYKQAIIQSGVKKVVHLSSIGAHTTEGNGVLSMHYYAEQILTELPSNVSIKFMRPVGFYTNIFRFMQSIKANGTIVMNYGGDKKEPWVSPLDIASTISEEIEKPFVGRSIRYIASEEISPNEIAYQLGKAIGKPDLKWVVVNGDELLDGMVKMGMNQQIAKGFIDMQSAQGDGSLYEDYYKNEPAMGKTKFEDFAKKFAETYKS